MIRKTVSVLVLFLFSALAAEGMVEVKYFYATNCKACLHLKDKVLPKLEKKYEGKVVWKHLEISTDKDAFLELYNLSVARGRDKISVPSMLIGPELLTGVNTIKDNFDDAYKEAFEQTEKNKTQVYEKDIKSIYQKFSLPAILLFGLLDGVNPCAFAVIIFFVSFLSVYGYGRREVVYIGSAYCIAVFISYLMLGLGVFRALYVASGFYTVIKIFYWIVAGLCFTFFALSIYDFFKYTKTGKTDGMILQLPKSFKLAVNKVFGKFLRGKKGVGVFQLTVAALVVGFLVSLIEAVCTGQVYVPVLAFILKEPGLKTKALFYLIAYNIAFVMPLVLVFVLSLIGHKSATFDNFLKKHLAAIKLLLALVFLALGVMLVVQN